MLSHEGMITGGERRVSFMTLFPFAGVTSKAFRKNEIADDMSGNCPPSDLGITHLRNRALSTVAEGKIARKPSAVSSPSKTLRKSLTCTRKSPKLISEFQ